MEDSSIDYVITISDCENIEMKETMSNIDIRMMLPELKKNLEGSFIKNVYQYGDVFVLKLYQPSGGTSHLLIQPGTRIHLSEYRRVAPRIPPKFCTVLRKYLRDRRIHSIQQHDLDRIVIIEVGDDESSYKLVAELFGQGNLLLLDPENTIFIAMRYRRMRDRNIIPKANYELPPPRGSDIFNLTPDQLIELIKDSTSNIIRTLTSRLNLDSLSCEEICGLSGISPTTHVSDFDAQMMKDLQSGMEKFVSKLKMGVNEPRIILSEAEEEDEIFEKIAYTPFHFTIFDTEEQDVYDSFSKTLDEFYGVTEEELEDTEEMDARTKEQKRLRTIIEKQEESITRLRENANELRIAGELIYSNFQKVTEVLETVTQARDNGYSWNEIIERIEEGKQQGIESAQIIERIVPSQAQIVIKLEDTEVKLDIRKTTQDNASKAYDQAKKSESKIEGATKQIEKTRDKLKKIDEMVFEPDTEAKAMKIRKKRWYEKYRWFISSEGFLVLGGRDTRTNERLAKRQMGPNDVFLHASIHGAPYVIIKVPEQPPGQATLEQAAQFAVTFSRAWQDGLNSGDAYWVSPEQVSFTPPSGEYLPAGGVMIYGNKNYIRNAPVGIFVGIEIEDDYAIPISGPPDAIKTQTDFYVQIIPGKTKKGQLVKRIINGLKQQVPEEHKIILDQIPQEEIMRVLPPGDGELVNE